MVSNADFFEDLDRSNNDEVAEKIKQKLKEHFKADDVIKNERAGDDLGIDYFVIKNGRTINVDAKVRDVAFADYEDVAIETWSNVENQKIGWSRDDNKLTDYVIWLWTDGECKVVDFRLLCNVVKKNWEQWIQEKQTARQKTNGLYTSECVFVSIKELDDLLFDEFFN